MKDVDWTGGRGVGYEAEHDEKATWIQSMVQLRDPEDVKRKQDVNETYRVHQRRR